jgi:hypothetical protein
MSISRRNFLFTALAIPTVDVNSHFAWAHPRLPTNALTASGEPSNLNALAQLSPVRKITVPGKAFAVSVRRFLAELLACKAASKPYPIARAFDILPFRLIDGGVATRLAARGDLAFSGGGVSNHGEYIEAVFNDQNLGILTVVFDEDLSAHVSEPSSGELLFDFAAHPIVALLQGANKKYLIDTNQRVLAVRLSTYKAVYLLASASPTSPQHLEITVDLTLDEGQAAAGAPSPLVASLSLAWPPPIIAMLVAGGGNPVCKCKCCGTDVCSPGCPTTDQSKVERPFADLWAQCLTLSGNRVTAKFDSNVLGFRPGYDPATDYVNRTLVVRQANFGCSEQDSTASAKFTCDKVDSYERFCPPNCPYAFFTYLYGTYISKD